MSGGDDPNNIISLAAAALARQRPTSESLTEDEQERFNQYKGELPRSHKPPFLMSPFGSPDEMYETKILENIIRLERASKMLTNAEQRKVVAEAVSDVITKTDMTSGSALGLAFFMAMRKSKREALTFPVIGGLRAPDPTRFPPSNFTKAFPFISSIRGQPATLIWHFLRISAYYGAIQLTVVPPLHIYVKVEGVRKMTNHPALKDLTTTAEKNLAAAQQKAIAERRLGIPRGDSAPKPIEALHESLSESRQRQRRAMEQRQHEAAQATQRSAEDGGEPGADKWNSSTYSTTDQQSSPSSWDPPVSTTQQQRAPQPPPQRGGASGGHSQPGAPSWGSSPEFNDSMGSDMFEDDASPVAPGSRAGAPQQGTTSWEEVRKRSVQGRRGARQQPQAPQGDETGAQYGSSGQEGQYTYAETDKTKAQKEFDAMLAAERKGTGNDNWKRW